MSVELNLPITEERHEIFTAVQDHLGSPSLRAASVDMTRPWGGFFVIDEGHTDPFIEQFFPGHDTDSIRQYGDKLSPKLLVVGPEEELSWQYHFRRAELWRCVEGPVGYHRSQTDELSGALTLAVGETVQFDPGEQHRLIGNGAWGVVAEFWQHTDPSNPSDEDDIVRLADRYGR